MVIDFQEHSNNYGRSFKGRLKEFFLFLKMKPYYLGFTNLYRSFYISLPKFLGFYFLYLCNIATSTVKNFSGVSLNFYNAAGFYILSQRLLTSLTIFLLIYPSSSSSSLKSLTQNKIVLGDYCLNWSMHIYKIALSCSYCEPVYWPRVIAQMLMIKTSADTRAKVETIF